jgi:hypothetical protein
MADWRGDLCSNWEDNSALIRRILRSSDVNKDCPEADLYVAPRMVWKQPFEVALG